MATGEPVVYQDFSGGIHLEEGGTYLLADNQCKDCRDVRTTEHGALTKRNGFTAYSDLTGALDYAHTLFPINLGTRLLLAAGPNGNEDRIYYIDQTGLPVSLKTGLASETRWEWVQGPVGDPTRTDQGPIYGMNGSDTPQQWSGVAGEAMSDWTAWQGTVPDGCPLLIYHLDKFWASGDPAYPGRVWSTGVNDEAVVSTLLPDPCNWDTDFIDDVQPEDGEGITALGKVGPYLLVFKERQTFVLSDPVGRAYRPLSSTIGCVAHRSVVETEQGTMFLSEDLGVCVTDGSQIRTVSENIDPLLDRIADENPNGIRNAAATYYRDSYVLSVPLDSADNAIILEYQMDSRSWWIHSAASNAFALLDPSGIPRLYSAAPGTPRIDRAFDPTSYTDNGQPYESYWDGPYWAWGNPHLNKRVTQLRADGRGNWQLWAQETFDDAYLQIDDTPAGGWEKQDTGEDDIFGPPTDNGVKFGPPTDDDRKFGPPQAVTQRRYPTPLQGWGRAWSIKITDGGANANRTEIYSLAAFIRARTD